MKLEGKWIIIIVIFIKGSYIYLVSQMHKLAYLDKQKQIKYIDIYCYK